MTTFGDDGHERRIEEKEYKFGNTEDYREAKWKTLPPNYPPG